MELVRAGKPECDSAFRRIACHATAAHGNGREKNESGKAVINIESSPVKMPSLLKAQRQLKNGMPADR